MVYTSVTDIGIQFSNISKQSVSILTHKCYKFTYLQQSYDKIGQTFNKNLNWERKYFLCIHKTEPNKNV